MNRRKYGVLVAFGLLCGLLVVPAGTAGAIPIYPGNPGDLQVTFDNTGEPGFLTGPAVPGLTGVGSFRMNTGVGSGDSAGGKVFLHSTELDDDPVDDLDSISYQYYIDLTSESDRIPYVNLRVISPNFDSPGARTLATPDVPADDLGVFDTITVDDDDEVWAATGSGGPIICGGEQLSVGGFSIEDLANICADTTIVAIGPANLGGVSIVTGVSNGANWTNWTGVIDNVQITTGADDVLNTNVYDLEPPLVTITPASPVALSSRSAQTVPFTLQASGWNSFVGVDTTGVIPFDLIVFDNPVEVAFNATGATSVSGTTGAFPLPEDESDLLPPDALPPPSVTLNLAVTDALIGDASSINVVWDGVNAVPSPATTVLQLPAPPVEPPVEPPVPPAVPGEDLVGLVDPVTGVWSLRGAAGGVTTFYYGDPGDVPFAGDWDCDGVDTPGLYRQSDGFVYLRNSNTQGIADIRFFFGNPGDIPMAGDFDNDGCDTVGIYRPSETTFYVINDLGANNGGLGPADFSFIFGDPGDKPFVGDFNGDGIDTIGLHRESTGIVYFRQTNTTGVADAEFFYGNPDDRFVAGDWVIVDGVQTPGVYRPSNATFFLRDSNTQGVGDVSFTFGTGTEMPIAGIWGP